MAYNGPFYPIAGANTAINANAGGNTVALAGTWSADSNVTCLITSISTANNTTPTYTTAFVRFGNTSGMAMAVDGGDMPIPPNQSRLVSLGGDQKYASAITDSGSCTIEFTIGYGGVNAF